MSFEVIAINLLLAVPVFLLCRFLFLRIVNEASRKWAIWLATIVLTPCIYVSGIMLWVTSAIYYLKREFDNERWKSKVETRYEMTDDLIDNGKLIGKTKDEIRDLLGEAESTFDSSRWTYDIGFRPGIIVIDPDVLEIKFEDGKVVKCWTRST